MLKSAEIDSIRKKSGRHTIKLQMILLFFLISIPALFLSFLAGQMNIRVARRHLLQTKENSMQMLVNQYDVSLNSVKEYLGGLLYGMNEYTALQFSHNDTRYQQAKIWLKAEMEGALNYYPILSGFYVYIPHTKERFMVRRKNELTLQTQENLLEILDKKGRPVVNIMEDEEGQYFVQGYKNSYLEIGYVIPMEVLHKQVEGTLETDEFLKLVIPDDKEAQIMTPIMDEVSESDCQIIEIGFSSIDAMLRLSVPEAGMLRKISIADKGILYGSITLLVLLPVFLIVFRKIFLVPMKGISNAMQQILKGNSEYRIRNFSKAREFYEIESVFNHTLDYNKTLKLETYELKLEKEKEKLINLQLQINPHLLLNSLNTIYSLAANKKNAEIQDFSMNLAKYFRYSLRDITEFVTIQSEIEFIKSYVKVQRIRYPDAFYVIYDIEEDIMQENIPPLIIQNFVENSTKYGLKNGHEIEILVIVKKEDGYLRISICDNGRGIDEEILKQIQEKEIIYDSRGKHIGIWDCINRLYSFYGDDIEFNITSQIGEGTQVWLKIPCQKEEKAKEGDTENEFADN